MARINVTETDHDGREVVVGWFDPARAERFEEGERWDGRNSVSLATGSDREHETLYKTAGGRWVLGWSSAYASAQDRYRFAGEDEAREWLVRSEYPDADIEAATGDPMPAEMGRPEIGPQIKVRLSPETLARVDEMASTAGVSRSAWVRATIEGAVRGGALGAAGHARR